jgi:hypothetical protein
VLRAIADALELSSEQMMGYAGVTPTGHEEAAPACERPGATERAIMSDDRLTAADRQTLLALYRRLAGPPE